MRFFTFAAPSRFYALAGALTPWLWAAAALLAGAGLYIGFFVAPVYATQGYFLKEANLDFFIKLKDGKLYFSSNRLKFSSPFMLCFYFICHIYIIY